MKSPLAFLIILTFIFLSFLPVFADPASDATNTVSTNAAVDIDGFAFGFKGDVNWSQLPNDLKFGVTANTPFFFGGYAAVRGEADVGLIRGIPVSATLSNSTWSDYYAYKAGIVLTASRRTDVIRPYIESGLICIFPSASFTSDTFAWGIYGLFGFDVIFPGDYSGYFFELGGTGLLQGGNASLYTGSQMYGTGLIITMGWRFYL